MRKPCSNNRSYTGGGITIVPPIDTLWNENAKKYKCCCRTLHVTRATTYIAYVEIMITFIFATIFSFYYVQAINGRLSSEHWINQMGERYISSLLFAVTLQLLLNLLLLHGIRTERRSFLVPFIVFASIAILFGCVQIAHDFIGFMQTSSHVGLAYDNSQFLSHLIGIMVHLWCVIIVWRCYGFLGDKKVARQIGEQLSTTHVAFHYGEMPYEYAAMPQPPPYADTVISGDKQPLTTA